MEIEKKEDKELKYTSIGEWMCLPVILFIPIVSIIILCVLAFSDSVKEDKKRFALAMLFWQLIIVVIFIFVYIILVLRT